VTAAPPSAQEDARRLYLAGRQAFDAGRLELAAESFTAAYRLEPKPGLLWNLAQTFRRQFMLSQKPEVLRRAVDAYRRYITEAPDGANRAEAEQLLDEMTRALLRLTPDAVGGAPLAAPAASGDRDKTEILIVADVDHATVAVDDQPPSAAPLLAEVLPGEHRVEVRAEHHLPLTLRLLAVAGRLVTAEARLVPRPGELDVVGPRGGRLIVDEHVVGRLPQPTLALPAGAHFVGVVGRGRAPWTTTLTVTPGGHTRLDVRLRTTAQRRAVPWVAAGAGAITAAGIVFGGLWGQAESSAKRLSDQLQNDQLTGPQYDSYEGERERRDQFRAVTITLVAVGLASGIAAGALYYFDMPSLPAH
jgi:hypothetical protein